MCAIGAAFLSSRAVDHFLFHFDGHAFDDRLRPRTVICGLRLLFGGGRGVQPFRMDPVEHGPHTGRHEGRITNMGMTPDGFVIWTAGAEGKVKFWNAITRESVLIWMGNVFALLGLRALFVLVEGMIRRFRYLDETIAVVLALVAVKLLIEDIYKIGPVGSLAIVAVAFAVGITALGAGLVAAGRLAMDQERQIIAIELDFHVSQSISKYPLRQRFRQAIIDPLGHVARRERVQRADQMVERHARLRCPARICVQVLACEVRVEILAQIGAYMLGAQ